MKKLLIFILTIIMFASCKLRNERIVIRFLDGTIDTVQLRYRGKLKLNLRRDLYDANSDVKAFNVKDFSIIKP